MTEKILQPTVNNYLSSSQISKTLCSLSNLVSRRMWSQLQSSIGCLQQYLGSASMHFTSSLEGEPQLDYNIQVDMSSFRKMEVIYNKHQQYSVVSITLQCKRLGKKLGFLYFNEQKRFTSMLIARRNCSIYQSLNGLIYHNRNMYISLYNHRPHQISVTSSIHISPAQ